MKVGDLVKIFGMDGEWKIGVVTEITEERRYKVLFPNAPKPWWNEGTWSKRALEVL